jgi:hypothetical protein
MGDRTAGILPPSTKQTDRKKMASGTYQTTVEDSMGAVGTSQHTVASQGQWYKRQSS